LKNACLRTFGKVKVEKRHKDGSGSGGIAPPFLTSVIDSGQPHVQAALLPVEKGIGAHWAAGWRSSRAALDAVEKRKTSRPCRKSNPGRTARRCTTGLSQLSKYLATAKIQSRYFPNTGVECYHCNNPLGINRILFRAMWTYFHSEEICAM
jgi:hypothetical protein